MEPGDSTMPRDLIIIGDGAFAEVACEYFTHDSPYRVAAFAVERAYLKRDRLLDRPVVALEEMAAAFPPERHAVHVAIVYSQLNRLRARLLAAAKAMGYAPASYVSPRAFVWRNAVLGEHCFIFEGNVVQPFVRIGDNVVLWSGNHVGHHSTIADNVFVSSHVVISGFCTIGRNSFLGVNATLANTLTVGTDCWIGPGVAVTRDVPDDTILRAPAAEAAKISARRFFKAPADQ